jgi:hypothetical protein
VGRKGVKWAMRWGQEGEKARGLHADKKVECEKTQRNISGLKRWSLAKLAPQHQVI